MEKESSLFSDGVGREFVSVPRLFRMRKMRAHLVGQPPLSAFRSFLAHRNGGSVAVADWRGEKRLYVFYIDLSKTPESRNRDASASLFLFSGFLSTADKIPGSTGISKKALINKLAEIINKAKSKLLAY